jgi:hypothetical protein
LGRAKATGSRQVEPEEWQSLIGVVLLHADRDALEPVSVVDDVLYFVLCRDKGRFEHFAPGRHPELDRTRVLYLIDRPGETFRCNGSASMRPAVRGRLTLRHIAAGRPAHKGRAIMPSESSGPNPYLQLADVLHELFWLAAQARSGKTVSVDEINGVTDPSFIVLGCHFA